MSMWRAGQVPGRPHALLRSLLADLAGRDAEDTRVIKPKSFYAARYAWRYVTRFPGCTTETIARSQWQYSDEQIADGLRYIRSLGYIRWQGAGYVAVVGFMVWP